MPVWHRFYSATRRDATQMRVGRCVSYAWHHRPVHGAYKIIKLHKVYKLNLFNENNTNTLLQYCMKVHMILSVCWYWFRHLFGVVDWQTHLSAQFVILSGVRQGGICSCWFFNICIDGIIRDLEESGLGCYFKGVFVGCLCYADDVILLWGSVVKLQSMLNKCSSYAVEWKFTFNGKKSCCMVFGRDFYDKLPQMVIG